MTTIQSLIDKYSSRSEGLTGISSDEVLRDLKALCDSQEVTNMVRFSNEIKERERCAFNSARELETKDKYLFDSFDGYYDNIYNQST